MSAAVEDVPAISSTKGASARRVVQFVRAIGTQHDARVDRELRRLLASDAQWALLERLAPFDRAHHLGVYRRLAEHGHADPDLLRAALLHDVGKADARGRVRAAHRVAAVLLRRFAPLVFTRLTKHDRRGPLHGLYLTRHHAMLGARLAAEVGASPRCCALIEHHEDERGCDNPALVALVTADEAAIT